MLLMTGTQKQVAELFARNLHLEVPSADADLFKSGLLDSLGLVEMLALLEQHFGVEITLDDLELDHFRSVAAIARFVTQREAIAA